MCMWGDEPLWTEQASLKNKEGKKQREQILGYGQRWCEQTGTDAVTDPQEKTPLFLKSFFFF